MIQILGSTVRYIHILVLCMDQCHGHYHRHQKRIRNQVCCVSLGTLFKVLFVEIRDSNFHPLHANTQTYMPFCLSLEQQQGIASPSIHRPLCACVNVSTGPTPSLGGNIVVIVIVVCFMTTTTTMVQNLYVWPNTCPTSVDRM